ncbi:hypothetical protein ACFYWX_00060 [Streptomyces sp. NPDC002888]|uniref:hypothetical protein n=1 Tax=Streptomyces sp. NPDC002888 TaxID=3364668 RepID=UPI0036BCC22D
MYIPIAIICVALFVAALVFAARHRQQSVHKFAGLGVAAANLAVASVMLINALNSPGTSAPDDTKSTDVTIAGEPNSQVDLCFKGAHGTGRAGKGSSLVLLVHGLDNAEYHLAHHIADEQEWRVPTFQVGASKTQAGTRYELVVWKFDAKSTEVASRLNRAQFESRPPGVEEVASLSVIRKAAGEKDHC